MRKWLGALPVALALAIPAAAYAQQVGDWALSRWRGSSEYYPGVIVARSGDKVTIKFDDGTVDTEWLSNIRPYDWTAGSAVECRWTDGQWYSAHIRRMGSDGTSLIVRYDDDGVEQRTQTGNCRAR